MSGCCDTDVIQGAQGPDGKSAYQIWLDEGNVGTVDDFLNSLVGATGSQGPIGLTGPTGATGATGATGPTGADGDDGASYLTGTGNPSASLGEDGDTYSNNANGQIWKKSSGVWTFTGYTLLGPQGVQGPIGLTGATGAAGTNGTNGTNGTDGLGYDNTTSSTSITLGSLGATTSMTWTTDKAFIAGSRVRVADSSNPSANFFEGVVNTYNQFTGAVDLVDVGVITGSGTISAWNVSIAGEQGGASSTPAWSAVLATGNTSGAYDPTIDAGQKLGLNGGTTNALEYNTYVSGVPQLKGASGAAITDGVGTEVSVGNTNAVVDTPVTGALVLPSSNNPTVDVTTPIEGMVKARTQTGNKDIEAYINGSWTSLTNKGDTNGVGKWVMANASGSIPGSAGTFNFDNVTVTSATLIRVTDLDDDGVNKGSVLNILAANDYFYIQQVDNVNNFALVKFSSVTDNGSYVAYGINSITVVGSFSVSDKFFIVPISKGGGGGSNTNIIANDLTQSAKRTQDLAGNTQDWQNGKFTLTDVTIIPNVVNLGNTSTSLTIDFDTNFGNMFVATATDNFTLNFSNVEAGIYYLKMIQDGTGSRVLTLGTNADSPGGVTPLLTTTAGAKDWLTLLSDGTNVSVFVANDMQ